MTMQVQVEEPAVAAVVAAAAELAAVAEPAVVQEAAAAGATDTDAPAAAPELAAVDVAAGRERRKFTVAEYYRMGEVGILHHTERVELIDGEVIVMSPVGVPHATVVDRLNMTFAEQARGRYIVRVQNPVHLDDYGEPQPDLVLLRPRDYSTGEHHPGPEDMLLAVEVSDSTLTFDLRVKSQRYAAAGIPEMWVMNLPGDCLERLDQPGPAGYGRRTTFRRGGENQPGGLAGFGVGGGGFAAAAAGGGGCGRGLGKGGGTKGAGATLFQFHQGYAIVAGFGGGAGVGDEGVALQVFADGAAEGAGALAVNDADLGGAA